MSKHPSKSAIHHKEPGNETGRPEEAGTIPQEPEQERAGNTGSGEAGLETGENPVNDTAAEAPAGGEEAAKGGESSGPEERIAELEAQNADLKDQLLRKAADVENFRKRINREKQDAIDFANQSLLLDLIPVLDDFDRAMQSAEISRDFTALYEGLGMIARRLSSILDSKWGLKSYISAGTLFDPNFHEALMMEKSSAVTEQTVQMDLLKGYTLKNRVIRSAKVKVLDPDPSAPAIEAPKAVEDPVEAEGEGKPET
ncbi:MAG: nucleotide exchange factor GrpE [Treponema sp.]|nr:nucleotide exchange factor GrpE [Treponema sp.]